MSADRPRAKRRARDAEQRNLITDASSELAERRRPVASRGIDAGLAWRRVARRRSDAVVGPMKRRWVAADTIGGGWRLARGMVPLRRATPRRLAQMATAVRRTGLTFAGLVRVSAVRNGRDVLVDDERGSVTAAQLDRWSQTVAAELTRRDIVWPGGRVGLLCRSHRGFVIAAAAASHAGTDAVFLPPEMPAAVLAGLLRTERIGVVIHDDDLGDLLDAARFRGTSVIADRTVPGALSLPALAVLPQAELPSPQHPAELIVLTGGSTGQPRSTVRPIPTLGSALPIMTLFRHLEIRPRSAIMIAPPLHHGFGFGFLSIALGLGCRTVLPGPFVAERALAQIDDRGVETLVVLPAMLDRLTAAAGDRPAPSSLRAIVSGFGPLDAELHQRAVDAFGPIVYNLYGSTEAGWCTLADPDDLRRAPGTIGRPAAGVEVAVLGPDDRPVPAGQTGRLCVSGPFGFTSYGDGGDRPRVGALIDTGDLGHRDPGGYLFVDGRADEPAGGGRERMRPARVERTLRADTTVATCPPLRDER